MDRRSERFPGNRAVQPSGRDARGLRAVTTQSTHSAAAARCQPQLPVANDASTLNRRTEGYEYSVVGWEGQFLLPDGGAGERALTHAWLRWPAHRQGRETGSSRPAGRRGESAGRAPKNRARQPSFNCPLRDLADWEHRCEALRRRTLGIDELFCLARQLLEPVQRLQRPLGCQLVGVERGQGRLDG